MLKEKNFMTSSLYYIFNILSDTTIEKKPQILNYLIEKYLMS